MVYPEQGGFAGRLNQGRAANRATAAEHLRLVRCDVMIQKEMPMLILQESPIGAREWVLSKPVISIGRDESNDVVLPDRWISRQHARIRRDGDQYVIEDCGSKNGTFVNGELLKEPTSLRDGDEIQLALGFRLLFVAAEATAPLTLRRTAAPALQLDAEGRRVWVAGQELTPPLSTAQFTLLELLYRNAGKVVTRDEVAEAVWPEAAGGVSEQAIDALVRRLRERIAGVDARHQYVVTVRGHGFRLEHAE